MTKKLAVLVIHGMGSQESNYTEPMTDEIKDRLKKKPYLKNPDEVEWEAVYWAPVIDKPETEYYEKMKQQTNVDWLSLRKFVIKSFGDASAYRYTKNGNNYVYNTIHGLIKKSVNNLYLKIGSSNDVPLIVMAHSLGGHIISNYIYDLQKHGTGEELSLFEQFKTLSGIITFGCNIPLFTFACNPILPINFPEDSLPDELKQLAEWNNYYDPDDVLGYPLQPIDEYQSLVSKDIPINVGGILTHWNPSSHTKYWTDDDFTKPVTKQLAQFL